MNSEHFVFPFNLGLYFILIYSVVRSTIWFRNLSRSDKLRLQRGFFGLPFMQSIREIFMESLLHRRIFKRNPVLGYMHMSLAFGWFLLIVLVPSKRISSVRGTSIHRHIPFSSAGTIRNMALRDSPQYSVSGWICFWPLYYPGCYWLWLSASSPV